MRRTTWMVLAAAMGGLALALAPALAFTPASGQAPPQPAPDGVQDLVFLGEARPVLIRLHLRLDGKAVQAQWDEFLKQLFTDLDVNKDGVLSKQEAERAPTVEQILSGLPVGGLAGLAGIGGGSPRPSVEEMDSNKDGQVTPAELNAYYRKQGFRPIQFQHDTKQPNPLMMAIGGGSTEPTVEAISDAMFKLLDTNRTASCPARSWRPPRPCSCGTTRTTTR